VTRTSAAGTNTAVVIGGSFAGLLAARVLADRFDEVIIVDRDDLPGNSAFRKGVPQSRHLHVLLARGAQILEGLLPGFLVELEAEGAVPLRWPTDLAILGAAGWAQRDVRGLNVISARREVTEHVVRRRVLGMPAVRPLERYEAVQLLAARDGAVRGIRVRSRPDGAERDIDADLVVDASGRVSRAPAWLEDLGYGVPPETIINASLGYASRVYAGTADGRDWRAAFLFPKPPDVRRGGAVFPVERDLWHVTLGGIGGDYPPTDESGFNEFAQSLRSPILWEAIREAEPQTGITAYRRTENQIRHHDALRRWPDGFIVTGDAACCFNPIYGQGMTVAGQDALVLREWLADGTSTHEFQRRLSKALVTPWVLATSEDFRYPTTVGGRPSPMTRLMHRYLDRVNAAAVTDRVVAHAFTRVLHMVGRPSELFHPDVVLRALRSPRDIPYDPSIPPPRSTRTTAASLAHKLGLREGRVAVDSDVGLHYVEAGEGPLVLFIHGFPEFWYSWRHQLPALAHAGYRAVALDMRGYNRSDKPRGIDAYGLPTLARDVRRAIVELGASTATVVGHDWGGLVAWELAMQHPDVVERLAIINAPHPERGRASLRTPRQLRRSWYIGLFQLPVFAEAYVRWGDYQFVRRAFMKGSTGNRPDDIERYVEAMAVPGALTAGINYYRALGRMLLRERDRSRRIDAPVLVIWGEQDPYLGAELAEPDRRLVPDLRVERLDDVGHWAQIDRPGEVNAFLVDFLPRKAAAGDRRERRPRAARRMA
jgi:pimeloyl-ACP methyl ester carboxylesterase/2-polyprenyl-6-methoxyphenol hydroxylase-like FAD-dependent oxidoreductase